MIAVDTEVCVVKGIGQQQSTSYAVVSHCIIPLTYSFYQGHCLIQSPSVFHIMSNFSVYPQNLGKPSALTVAFWI